jgi:single-strand DNA-binding protein
MNKIAILGRLTKDPQMRYTQSQKVVTTFTLAVDRPFLNQDGKREADFIPVVVWGKAAELVGNSCKKGHRLLVEGRLQIRNFDAKDGTKHWVTEIIATNIEFIERREQPKDMANMGTDVTKDAPFDDINDIPF